MSTKIWMRKTRNAKKKKNLNVSVQLNKTHHLTGSSSVEELITELIGATKQLLAERRGEEKCCVLTLTSMWWIRMQRAGRICAKKQGINRG